MWDLPGPGIKSMSPALAGRLSTTGPPGKSILVTLIPRSWRFWGWKGGWGKVTFYHLDGNSQSLWGHRGTGRGMWVEREGGGHWPPASGMEPNLNEGTQPRDSYRHPHLLEWLSSMVRVTKPLSQHSWNKQSFELSEAPRYPLWPLPPSGWLFYSGSVTIASGPLLWTWHQWKHTGVWFTHVCVV